MRTILTLILLLVLTGIGYAQDDTISFKLDEELKPRGEFAVVVGFSSSKVVLEDREEIARFKRQAELLVLRLEQAERKWETQTNASVTVYPLHVKASAPHKDGIRYFGNIPVRTWTDITGKFRLQAVLVKYADGLVSLRKGNGHVVKLPLRSLSDVDREFVYRRFKE